MRDAVLSAVELVKARYGHDDSDSDSDVSGTETSGILAGEVGRSWVILYCFQMPLIHRIGIRECPTITRPLGMHQEIASPIFLDGEERL